MQWPNNADGDVFRNLKSSGFPFDKQFLIDFNIDYKDWPPSVEAINALKAPYPSAKVSFEEEYVKLQIYGHLSYRLVIDMQASLSQIAAPFSGWCDSWGVLWNPITKV